MNHFSTSRPNRLKAQAEERDMSVLDLIKEAIQSEGSKIAAARKLGVAGNTIAYHLKKAHLEVDTRQVIIFREVQS